MQEILIEKMDLNIENNDKLKTILVNSNNDINNNSTNQKNLKNYNSA